MDARRPRRVWEPSCEALSITSTSTSMLAAVRFEGGEASLEVVPGVEVHDDDGQLGRPGIGAHECGVCATSTMPVMMKNTPAHRSGGICSCRTKRSASRINTYVQRGERIGERQRGAGQHREPDERRQAEQEQPAPHRPRGRTIPSATARSAAARRCCAVTSFMPCLRVSWARAASATDSRIRPISIVRLLPFSSLAVMAFGEMRLVSLGIGDGGVRIHRSSTVAAATTSSGFEMRASSGTCRR